MSILIENTIWKKIKVEIIRNLELIEIAFD